MHQKLLGGKGGVWNKKVVKQERRRSFEAKTVARTFLLYTKKRPFSVSLPA